MCNSTMLPRAVAIALAEHRVFEEFAARDRCLDARQILIHDTSRADVEMPDFRITHLRGGKTTHFSEASIVVCA